LAVPPRGLSLSGCSVPEKERCGLVPFFFFEQKTAYEIGLGIPAEPLFRSSDLIQTHHERQKQPYGRQHTYHHYRTQRPAYEKTRSEERRVGKECRTRMLLRGIIKNNIETQRASRYADASPKTITYSEVITR